MTADNLKESLKQLHANLETAGSVDPELKQLLQLLERDIQQLLSREAQGAADVSGLADRAQAISAQFAAEHPHVEPVLRDLGNILASMGI